MQEAPIVRVLCMILDSEPGYPGQVFGRVLCHDQNVYGGGFEALHRLSFVRRGGCDVEGPDLEGYFCIFSLEYGLQRIQRRLTLEVVKDGH